MIQLDTEEVLDSIQDPFRHLIFYFTQKRVIIAKVGSDAALYTFGLLGQTAQTWKEIKIGKEMSNLTPDRILDSNKKNYAVNYSDITEIKASKGYKSIKFKIITKDNKKIKYAMPGAKSDKHMDKHFNTLNSYLSGKIIGP